MRRSLAASIIRKAQSLMDKSGITLDELGRKMGYKKGTARRAVWQLFNKVGDPRLSTLEALARALEVELKALL
jgi:transcriptional regulator with XRE-family HTH domain